MELKLNIYSKEDKKQIEKTYTAEGYDLMLGTIDDLVSIIDLDKMDDDKAVAAMIIKGYRQIKPLLHDVFGATEEELNRTRVADLVPCIIDICRSSLESFDVLKKQKNSCHNIMSGVLICSSILPFFIACIF